MRTRTQFSTLAIAAIAILAAATTSFAQTNAQTNERGAEANSTVAVSGNELAMNTQPASIVNTVRESFEAKKVSGSMSETRPVVKPLSLSAATFSAGSRFATVDATRFVSQQASTELKMSAGVAANSANELSETKTRNVEFVSCRVPKFPYRAP